MADTTTIILTVTRHSNGLVLATVIGGDSRRRHMLARGHATTDPEEGQPTSARLLLLGCDAVVDRLRAGG